MCGIVGVVNRGATLRIAVDALKRLEYRGYDSFGVASLQARAIATKKETGSVVEKDVQGFFASTPDSSVTIAHTRWATHGRVTQQNAHPHLSADGSFALVHNGVIENYRQLRHELLEQGVRCSTETDTEVIVQLMAKLYERTHDVQAALSLTLEKLEGEYAFVFATLHDPEHIYGARYKSPLAFGHADYMAIVASDQRAIAPLTQSVTFLEEGDVVRVSAGGVACYASSNGKSVAVTRPIVEVPWAGDDDDKHGHPHHMIKEIYEAPLAVEKVLKIPNLDPVVEDLVDREVVITGAGSSFYVSQIGQYHFASLARRYAPAHPSDEILALLRFDAERHHLIAVSQSGETFDTLEVMRQARSNGALVTSINNVFGSSCQRLATHPIYQGAGTEICVLSTKSIVSQVLVLYRLAALLARRTGAVTEETFDALVKSAQRLPETIQTLYEQAEEKIKQIAQKDSHIDNWFFIGRGIYYPVAMESALKFKEVSYLHAEGMPAGFFKHGTISLIDENFYTIAFLPNRELDCDTFRFTISNISEIQARGGKVIALGHEPATQEDVAALYDYIRLPSLDVHLDPVLHLIAGQLLAYYCATSLGRSIDKPRALAKSVTVR